MKGTMIFIKFSLAQDHKYGDGMRIKCITE